MAILPSGAAGFYREWILANGIAEAVGLGSTILLGRAIAPVIAGTPSVPRLLGAALGAVLAGIVLEGVVVGWAQAQVLTRHLPVGRRAWVRATVVGAALAWLIGMLPSTTIGIIQLQAAASPMPPPAGEPPRLVQYALALLLGAVTGPILGGVQARVLRRIQPPVRGWVVANAAAWAPGMLLLFVAMDLVPWPRGGAVVVVAVYGACAIVGLVVGAIHGRWLVPRTGASRAGGPRVGA